MEQIKQIDQTRLAEVMGIELSAGGHGMNCTIRQRRALRRASMHLRRRKSLRFVSPDRKAVATHWAESWPFVLAGLAIAVGILLLRVGDAL